MMTMSIAMIRMLVSPDNYGNVSVVNLGGSSVCSSLELMMRIGHAMGISKGNNNNNDNNNSNNNSNVNVQDEFWWVASHRRRTVVELVLPNS